MRQEVTGSIAVSDVKFFKIRTDHFCSGFLKTLQNVGTQLAGCAGHQHAQASKNLLVLR